MLVVFEIQGIGKGLKPLAIRQEVVRETEIKVSGRDAVEAAMSTLSGFAEKENVVIEIQIKEQTEAVDDTEETESDVGERAASDENGNRSKSTEESRNKEIRADTSHHHVLAAVDVLSNRMDEVTAENVKSRVEGYSEKSIRPALTELYKRELVHRGQASKSGGKYSYTLSDWGEEVLSKLGDPE